MEGHIHACWCYSIERVLKVIQTLCGNKNKIEASIAEAYCSEEVTNVTTKCYDDTLPSVHNPTPHYNADKNESKLSLFRGQLGRESVVTHKNLQHEEWHTITMYVLKNLEEVFPYVE
jgi:hypothetical protein